MCAGSSRAGAGGVYTDSPCLQTVAVSLSRKALLKINNNMCAVTDKVWTIKGVGSWWGGTPLTSLAPLQFSIKTSFTGVRCNFHTIELLSASQEVRVCGTLCLRLMVATVSQRLLAAGGTIDSPLLYQWVLVWGRETVLLHNSEKKTSTLTVIYSKWHQLWVNRIHPTFLYDLKENGLTIVFSLQNMCIRQYHRNFWKQLMLV